MKVFKNKKQRIVAVFLSLVFAFMLVPFTDAYALSSMGHIQSVNLDYEYVNDTDFTCSDNAFLVAICDNSDSTLRDGFYKISVVVVHQVTSSDAESGFSITFNGTKYSYTATPSDVGKYYIFSTSTGYIAKINDVIGMAIYKGTKADFESKLTHGAFLEDPNFIDSSSSGYSNEIGALKNVSRNTLYPDHANNVDSVFWRFRYASKTTKGFNVKTSGTKIRVYESVTYYKRSDDSVYSESPKVLVGEFDATGLQFDMDVNKAFNKTTSETDSQYIANAWTIMTKQIVRNDRIYLQVVDADGNYGDYLRIGGHADNASNATDNPQDVVDEDGNNVTEENGGYSTDDTDGDVGTSIDGDLDSADDDANSKPEEKENIGDSLDHAISTIRSLIDMIRHIPEIISILFSFLPPWCLSVVALGFVALVVLIAYKLIRG